MILALLVILVLISVNPGNIDRQLSRAFDPIINNAGATTGAVVRAMVVGSLLIGIASLIVLPGFVPSRIRSMRPWPGLWVSTGALAVVAAVVIALGSVESNHATRLLVQMDNNYSNVLVTREDDANARAEALFWLGMATLGLAGAACLGCTRLQRTAAGRWRQPARAIPSYEDRRT
jgi:hypothetical protein